MDREPLALVFVPDTALRTVLLELLHDCGFRVQTAVQRHDLPGMARTLPVSAIVAQGWALGLRLEQAERDEIEAVAKLAPLILIGAGQWAKEVSAEDLGAVCVFAELFDIGDFERQLRRCLELATNSTEKARHNLERQPT